MHFFCRVLYLLLYSPKEPPLEFREQHCNNSTSIATKCNFLMLDEECQRFLYCSNKIFSLNIFDFTRTRSINNRCLSSEFECDTVIELLKTQRDFFQFSSLNVTVLQKNKRGPFSKFFRLKILLLLAKIIVLLWKSTQKGTVSLTSSISSFD